MLPGRERLVASTEERGSGAEARDGLDDPPAAVAFPHLDTAALESRCRARHPYPTYIGIIRTESEPSGEAEII